MSATEEIPQEPSDGPDKTGFRQEWSSVFVGTPAHCQRRLRELAFAGELAESRFRSVAWKLFLGVIPANPKLWMRVCSRDREHYEKLKEKYASRVFKDAGKKQALSKSYSADVLDSSTESNGSSGQQVPYKDSDLRREIDQDVNRTFPDIPFFNDPKIRAMMCSILFVYAKENDSILYKQGMHELLALIILVLDRDQDAFRQCIKAKTKMSDRVFTVLRSSYMEHDAYLMFCKLMNTAKVWFEHKDSPFQQIKYKLWSSGEVDAEFSSPGLRKIYGIWDKLVKRHDPQLHAKLAALDIQPHIYGIRWLRLLFGRELHVDQVLQLWDAVFAFDLHLSLVDHVFTALLILLRDKLLPADYSSCLQCLMQHPKAFQASAIIPRALHLADSSEFPRPIGFVDYSQCVDKQKSVPQLLVSSHRGPDSPQKFQRNTPKHSSPNGKYAQPPEPAAAQLGGGRSLSLSNLFSAIMGESNPAKDPVIAANGHLNGRPVRAAAAAAADPNNVDAKCTFCATRLDMYIKSIQELLVEEQLQNEDKLLISIAGLKQVRDILNGSLRFKDSFVNEHFIDPSKPVKPPVIMQSSRQHKPPTHNPPPRPPVESQSYDDSHKHTDTKPKSASSSNGTLKKFLAPSSKKKLSPYPDNIEPSPIQQPSRTQPPSLPEKKSISKEPATSRTIDSKPPDKSIRTDSAPKKKKLLLPDKTLLSTDLSNDPFLTKRDRTKTRESSGVYINCLDPEESHGWRAFERSVDSSDGADKIFLGSDTCSTQEEDFG